METICLLIFSSSFKCNYFEVSPIFMFKHSTCMKYFFGHSSRVCKKKIFSQISLDQMLTCSSWLKCFSCLAKVHTQFKKMSSLSVFCLNLYICRMQLVQDWHLSQDCSWNVRFTEQFRCGRNPAFMLDAWWSENRNGISDACLGSS